MSLPNEGYKIVDCVSGLTAQLSMTMDKMDATLLLDSGVRKTPMVKTTVERASVDRTESGPYHLYSSDGWNPSHSYKRHCTNPQKHQTVIVYLSVLNNCTKPNLKLSFCFCIVISLFVSLDTFFKFFHSWLKVKVRLHRTST